MPVSVYQQASSSMSLTEKNAKKKSPPKKGR